MKHNIAFIHASPAAIPPLMQFYSGAAPDLRITNLLDDGLLRLFAGGSFAVAENRLREMLAAARDVYAAELAMLTCSAVPRPVLDRLRALTRIPVLKIDEPMARRAVAMGKRIGVVVTFSPTGELARKLLLDTAAELGREIDLDVEVLPEAYSALLAGDNDTHDRLLLAGIQGVAARQVDVVVLAQVSMARVLARAIAAVSVPILSSIETSLAAIREAIRRPA